MTGLSCLVKSQQQICSQSLVYFVESRLKSRQNLLKTSAHNLLRFLKLAPKNIGGYLSNFKKQYVTIVKTLNHHFSFIPEWKGTGGFSGSALPTPHPLHYLPTLT